MPSTPIVNYSHLAAADHESAVDQATADTSKAENDVVAAMMQAQVQRAIADLKDVQPEVNVLSTPRSDVASALQSYIAAQAQQDPTKVVPVAAGGEEVKFDNKDLSGWIRSFFTWWRGWKKAPFQNPPTGPEKLPDDARVAILGDWGTGMYGAPACTASIDEDKGKFDYLIHLGDVYYSGMIDEVLNRFLYYWPKRKDAISRALNSNHEMYTGGHGYFEKTLPAFKQTSSLLWLENSSYVVVGLDTAYFGEFKLGDAQIDWLNRVVMGAKGRKLVFLSHHQPFSLYEQPNAALPGAVSTIFDGKKDSVFAWYWGHEHRCVVFDPIPTWNGQLYGRCIGHSGFPYFRDRLNGLPNVNLPDGSSFVHVVNQAARVSGTVLDGPNPYVTGEENRFGPNGYAVLQFDGAKLTEQIVNPAGQVLQTKQLA